MYTDTSLTSSLSHCTTLTDAEFVCPLTLEGLAAEYQLPAIRFGLDVSAGGEGASKPTEDRSAEVVSGVRIEKVDLVGAWTRASLTLTPGVTVRPALSFLSR